MLMNTQKTFRPVLSTRAPSSGEAIADIENTSEFIVFAASGSKLYFLSKNTLQGERR